MARISVVIPAYNEERLLPRLLDDIAAARARHRAGADRVEIIVADNGSTDATIALAESRGCTVARVEPRIIAAVRNGGAAAARGELLVFVDADTRLHPETFNAIDDYFADGTRVVGVSGALPERRALGIDLAWMVMGALSVLMRYGVPRTRADCAPTGVVCCRHADWLAVGKYSETWRFAEDLWFLLALRRLGRRRGQGGGWLKGAPATFSTRKFDLHGDWHYLTVPLKLVTGMIFYRAGMERLVDRYWYGNQRETEEK